MVGFDTRIDIGIPAPQCEAIAQGLSRSLADTYTLYLKTQNYHCKDGTDVPDPSPDV
jgi:DNA-binding ferritin-like protein